MNSRVAASTFLHLILPNALARYSSRRSACRSEFNAEYSIRVTIGLTSRITSRSSVNERDCSRIARICIDRGYPLAAGMMHARMERTFHRVAITRQIVQSANPFLPDARARAQYIRCIRASTTTRRPSRYLTARAENACARCACAALRHPRN